MTDRDLEVLVEANYVALADLLEALPAERWDEPSPCQGWRVREVVAYLTVPAGYSENAFMAVLREDAFDFTRLSNRVASRDGELSTGELVENLRDEIVPLDAAGGRYRGELSHVVVNGLDITVPLREPRRASDTATRTVLGHLTERGGHAHFGTDIRGRSLYATDIDWSYGSGPRLRRGAEDLVLHICGRTVRAVGSRAMLTHVS